MKDLFIATRPWSFQMTIIGVLFGSAYAYWRYEAFNIPLVILALVGSILLHAAVNVWNDYFDYRYGVDKPGVGTTVYRPHPIYAGILTPKQTIIYGTLLGALALVIGILITVMGRPFALILGLLGFLLAFSYTGPPLRLKYNGLGEIGVIIAWGPLMALGGAYVASAIICWNAAIASIPFGLMVAAVLLANNIRDIESDKQAGLRTLAVLLGRRVAIKLYQIIILVSYLLIPAFIALRLLPLPALLTLLSLPPALKLMKEMAAHVPPDADPRTAKVTTMFGALYIMGVAGGGLLNSKS
jgi:1,4-dihydroxy-2-naphthoate octaprenyltransferase